VANWLDWSTAGQQAALTSYTRELMHFRSVHSCLRPADFFTGTDHNGNGLKDLTWYRDNGAEVDLPYFLDADNHFLAYRLDDSEFGGPANSVYVAYNGWIDPVMAFVPAPTPGKQWFVVADTSAAAEAWGNIHPSGQEVSLAGQSYLVQGRSLLLLIER
jgi:isoamylase